MFKYIIFCILIIINFNNYLYNKQEFVCYWKSKLNTCPMKIASYNSIFSFFLAFIYLFFHCS